MKAHGFWTGLKLVFAGGLGYSVLETSQFDQDVTFKNGVLSDAKLVIAMTRHTILLKDKVLHAIPSADIEQFKATTGNDRKAATVRLVETKPILTND